MILLVSMRLKLFAPKSKFDAKMNITCFDSVIDWSASMIEGEGYVRILVLEEYIEH